MKDAAQMFVVRAAQKILGNRYDGNSNIVSIGWATEFGTSDSYDFYTKFRCQFGQRRHDLTLFTCDRDTHSSLLGLESERKGSLVERKAGLVNRLLKFRFMEKK